MPTMERLVLRVRPISLAEFEKMVDAGVFPEDERLELLEGKIVRMTPQSDPHALSLFRTQAELERVFGKRCFVRVQAPLAFSRQSSRPEPDLAVARGRPRDWTRGVHTSALLVVEVSLTTLRLDQTIKARIYAGAGIGEYWIVNLRKSVLEVHRSPKGAGARAHYETMRVLGPKDAIAPLEAPRRKVRVKDLLP